MYSLNKYALLYEMDDHLFITFNNEKYDISSFEYEILKKENSLEDLIHEIGEKKIKEFIRKGLVINSELNKKENRLSRTDVFNRQTKFISSKNLNKKILILGAGGTGSNLCYLFVNSGFNNITILDYDKVEISNLNRQVIYTRKDIGRKKTDVLIEEFQNNIKTIEKKIVKKEDVEAIIVKENPDIILKCIDSPADIHSWIYEICDISKIPFISGGILNGEGYIQTFMNYSKNNRPIKINFKKIEGTSPSHPYLISKISLKIYEETLRILEKNEFVFYANLTKVKLTMYPRNEIYENTKNLIIFMISFLVLAMTNNLILSSGILLGLSGEFEKNYRRIFIFGFLIGVFNIIRNFYLLNSMKLSEIFYSLLIFITIPIIINLVVVYIFEYILYFRYKKRGFVNDTDH